MTEMRDILQHIKEAKPKLFPGADDEELKKRRMGRVYKRYDFQIWIRGYGWDIDEAWDSANEYYSEDPGGWDHSSRIEVVPIDEESNDEIGPVEVINPND